MFKTPLDEARLLDCGYVACRFLPDGRFLGVLPMTYGKGRLCIGENEYGYEDGWCYDSIPKAIEAMHQWNPDEQDEPTGWMRHPTSGRRRPDGDASKEYILR